MTGRTNLSLRVPRNDRTRHDAPTAGSVVSYFSPLTGIPATVTIPRPIGHEGVTYSGTSASGLLDETLVAMYGEFGRTPQINKNDGRDHWGACQSAVLAGGGIQGGQVYGTSDRDSAYPTSKPVLPEDTLATIYHAMGISPGLEMHDQRGRPHRVVDGKPLTSLF